MLGIHRLLALVGLSLGAGSACADTISIRADEWLPYNGSTLQTPPGYMIEMAKQIAAANGHTIDYSTLAWADALDAVRNGNNDCVVGALKSDAEGFQFPALAWGMSQNKFFALNDRTWRYEGLESLSKVRLAVIEDYSYDEAIDAYVQANKGDGSKIVMIKPIGRAVVNLISNLVAKKADVMIEDVNVANQSIARLGMVGRVIPVGDATEPGEIYVACTPAKPRGKEFAEMFSKGTAEMRKSGELAKILAKYSVADWMK